MALKGGACDTNVEWKEPFWQEPVTKAKLELALHEDGPLLNARREGFLQKRAGTSRFRWNVRYFELKDNSLRWWRPRFRDQLFQPSMPKVAFPEHRGRPVRCLDLTQLKSVTRTKVKFPYSSRILLRFHESYTKYQLELRSEKEIEIMAWYKVLIRFTLERYEVEVAEEQEETQVGPDGGRLDSGEDTDGPEILQPSAATAGESTVGPEQCLATTVATSPRQLVQPSQAAESGDDWDAPEVPEAARPP